jgi:hypothetical protein
MSKILKDVKKANEKMKTFEKKLFDMNSLDDLLKMGIVLNSKKNKNKFLYHFISFK